ncbi:hypothetical protein [Chitinophaga niabensis]|uniref:Uncharacterized protein n=1 Tax=Chitinophaga niabensis TaxID=536979 RepID=A0A1N6EN68_9BACT|nr:hypothetical protein [Chitinophaga niabensis]SIN84454.1 hypothetical protein SAMN04488055_1724 [Chitinophaga niabensis]
MQYLVQVQEIIYSYLNNGPMGIVLITFVIFFAAAIISALCFFLSLQIYKALRAKAFWLFTSFVLLFCIIYILINRYGLAISFDGIGLVLVVGAVMIAAGSALTVSEGFYRPLLFKKDPSAGRWRFLSFVLSFSLIFSIMEMIYLSNLEFGR